MNYMPLEFGEVLLDCRTQKWKKKKKKKSHYYNGNLLIDNITRTPLDFKNTTDRLFANGF